MFVRVFFILPNTHSLVTRVISKLMSIYSSTHRPYSTGYVAIFHTQHPPTPFFANENQQIPIEINKYLSKSKNTDRNQIIPKPLVTITLQFTTTTTTTTTPPPPPHSRTAPPSSCSSPSLAHPPCHRGPSPLTPLPNRSRWPAKSRASSCRRCRSHPSTFLIHPSAPSSTLRRALKFLLRQSRWLRLSRTTFYARGRDVNTRRYAGTTKCAWTTASMQRVNR